MKKTLFFGMLLCSLSSAAQINIDSVNSRMVLIENKYQSLIDSQETQFKSIRRNLVFAQNQYRTGTWIIVGGVAASTLGAIISAGRPDGQFLLPAAGGFVALVGWIIQVDSHKFIRRAGAKPTAENNWGRPPYKIK